tara:strand:- start:481 stop:933 length:453 start_codon:yes stop_codon:yes gene_type:complete
MSNWGSANHDAITMQQRTKEPEENLWTAVLTRAVQDVFTTSDWHATQAAIAWFKNQSRDFRSVCEFAGRNPQYVYTKIIPKINNREKFINTLKERRPYAKGMSPLIFKNKKGKKGRTKGTKNHLTGNAYYAARRVSINGKDYDSNNLSNV